MTLKEFVAWNRRLLEEAGILPEGKDDELEVLTDRLQMGRGPHLAQPGEAAENL